MAWKEFQYSCLGGDTFNYRPYVDVVISSENKEIRSAGLIDSGCQTTMIDIEVAEFLKIDLKNCEKVHVGGIGGEGGLGYRAEVSLTFPDFDFSFVSPVTFANIPTQLLLGQFDFFKHFKVLFETNGVFKLNPIKRIAKR